MIVTKNPSTGEALRSYEYFGEEGIHSRLDDAQHAFYKWKEKALQDRQDLFFKLADILEERKEAAAHLITLEMGKPLAQAHGEIEKCVRLCRFYAERGAEFLEDESLPSDNGVEAFVSYQPEGIILGIMPWNFPFWQVMRFAVPTMIAGNVVVLKHAPNTTGCGQMIEELFKEAGFTFGEYQSLIMHEEDTKGVLSDPRVRGVSLTGSTKAGKSVASLAGANLKKSVLELGGSDPVVVLDDADLERAVSTCIEGRALNAGQSCISPKRWIVTSKNKEKFLEMALSQWQAKKVGEPTDKNTDLGPLARSDLRDNLHDQVQKALMQGATKLCGGEMPEGRGFYYPATFLTDVDERNVAFKEELFGPVAVLIEANDEEDALRMANETHYGLGASLFSKDLKRAQTLARDHLNAGSCFVNQFVQSDPRWPFGGTRDSGYGRELGAFGIREFVNVKTVAVFS